MKDNLQGSSPLFVRTRNKRGRPKKKVSSHRDLGTEELQKKRRLLVTNPQKAHLTETGLGLLFAHHYLTEQQYEAGIYFMKLETSVKKIVNAPQICHIKWPSTRPRRFFPSLSQEEWEKNDEKKRHYYGLFLKEIKNIDQKFYKSILDLLQNNSLSFSLWSLLSPPSFSQGEQELNALKKVLTRFYSLQGKK